MTLNDDAIIAERQDGFKILFAKWNDFPKLKKIHNELSEETKKFYHQWMFKENPGMKIKGGQLLARLSLIPSFGKLIKFFFPFGYALIIKCISKNGEIVGFASVYNLKRRPNNNGFVAIAARIIVDEYQKVGSFGIFLNYYLEKVVKKKKITRLRAMVNLDNKSSLLTLEKQGWKRIDMEKDMKRYFDKNYENIELIKDL